MTWNWYSYWHFNDKETEDERNKRYEQIRKYKGEEFLQKVIELESIFVGFRYEVIDPFHHATTLENQLQRFLIISSVEAGLMEDGRLGFIDLLKLSKLSNDLDFALFELQITKGNRLYSAEEIETALVDVGCFKSVLLVGTFWYYTSDPTKFTGYISHESIRKYEVYRVYDANTNTTTYVGMTNDFARRAYEHSGRFTIQKIPGLQNLTYYEARAVEQTLIEHFKLGKNGGTLLNRINSIAVSNPIYAQALIDGTRILHNIQFPGF